MRCESIKNIDILLDNLLLYLMVVCCVNIFVCLLFVFLGKMFVGIVNGIILIGYCFFGFWCMGMCYVLVNIFMFRCVEICKFIFRD